MANTLIKPLSTTGIGSLPHRQARDAVELCLGAFDIPFWPQLPAVSFKESMVPQYSEGMPTVKMDLEKGAVWSERNEEEIARFYESSGQDARVAISEDFAKGLYEFLRQIKGRSFEFLKGQITGPLTFTLGLGDPEGKPIYYDEELREISLMLLQGKARWQVDVLGRHARKVIIFIDEPILSALGGTSYMGVTREETVRLLKETSGAIKAAGGISAIHCCGRADWPLVMETGVDILNFDAYGYGDTLAIYPEETTAFLEGGGMLAWGIVPTLDADDINNATEDSIARIFRERFALLSSRVPEDLLRNSMILTPSCGTGSRSLAETHKVFQLLMRLKEALL